MSNEPVPANAINDEEPDTPWLPPSSHEDMFKPEHPPEWRLTATEALHEIMRHVVSVLRPEHLDLYGTGDTIYEDPDSIVAAAFPVGSTGFIRFADIEPFARALFQSGDVTGYLNGAPVVGADLAKPETFAAMLRGDDVKLRTVEGKSSTLARELGSPVKGQLQFDPDQLATALANSKPYFDVVEDEDPGTGKSGGMLDPPFRITIALGAYVLTASPSIDFETLVDRVKDLWAEVAPKAFDDRYLKTMLRPLFDIAEAGETGAPRAEVEAIAKLFLSEDQAKRQKRQVKRR